MKENPLRKLQALGQSVWLDYTRRDLIATGQLRRLMEEDGLSGMTSNPSIFEKAIAHGDYYDDEIREMAFHGRSPISIYETLSQEDIQSAADSFRPVYDQTHGRDGYVSLEVNPHLAHDTRATIVEARRLWRALDRPNVFIKVPATAEGVPAIQQLISEGISVNVTLLFGLPRYRQVVEAYLAGLETRAKQGQPLKWVASVASFFLSRIDVVIDPLLETIMSQPSPQRELARKLHGEVAIASALRAYQIYQEIFRSERFRALEKHGGGVQRLLWASTSTKNPTYSQLKYIEALIGPKTINTVPLETLTAYRANGQPQSRLEENVQLAVWVLESLADVGINLDHITQQLEDEGVAKFNKAFDMLIEALTRKARDFKDAHTINEKGISYVA
jgi:transaldolase